VEGKTDKNHRENVGVNKIYMKVMAAAKPIYLTEHEIERNFSYRQGSKKC